MATTALVLLALAFVALSLWRYGGVLTPLTPSLVRIGRGLTSGALRDVLWRLSVLVVGLWLIYKILAASTGVFVSAIAAAVLSMIISPTARAVARDIWNRNFWIWRV